MASVCLQSTSTSKIYYSSNVSLMFFMTVVIDTERLVENQKAEVCFDFHRAQ